MSAIRKQIRNGLKTYLTGKTAAEGRIYTNRGESLFKAELPLILIYTRDESVEVFDSAPRSYKRTCAIGIEAVVEVPEKPQDVEVTPPEFHLDDALDDIGAEIEKALFENDTLEIGGENLCAESSLVSVETSISAEADREIGVIRQMWDFVYYEDAPGADFAPVTPFETAAFEYAPKGEEDGAKEDIIELQQ